MLSKMVSNPELMVLMQNAKLQEIMKKVMFSQIGNTCTVWHMYVLQLERAERLILVFV